jgi:hypothetical protein
MRHIPISRAAVSAANLGTNYSSLLPWCTRFHGSRHLQSWFRSWLTNFNPIRKKLHDFWPLPKCYKISTTRADPPSQVRKQEWKHTHTHTLSLSLSLNFALQKLIARRKIKRKVLCFFPRPQNIILSTRWREKCARKPKEAAGGKKNTKTFAKHTRSTQQSEQNSGSSRAGERLASVFF